MKQIFVYANFRGAFGGSVGAGDRVSVRTSVEVSVGANVRVSVRARVGASVEAIVGASGIFDIYVLIEQMFVL